MRFKGSIVIADPSYFVKNNEDWEACEFGDRLDRIGFTDFMIIRFPDDPQVVKEEKNGNVIGGICQDSGYIAVVYLDELKAYNAGYEKDLGDEMNRTIIPDFDGEISSKTVEVIIDGYKDTDTIISGKGNICFQSSYEEES